MSPSFISSGFFNRLTCRSRIIGWLLAVAALSLFQACSAVKLAYNNAPELGYWWLDGYADFDDSQSLKVRAELARLQQWHRTDELPKIADMLQEARRLAGADLGPAPVCALYAAARARFSAVTAQTERAALELAMSLGPEQLAHIERKFARKNADWRDEWLVIPASQRLEHRLKTNVERSEDFYGRLEERQLATLRAGLETSIFDPQLVYAERVRRQQDLLQTLRLASGAGPGVMRKTGQAEVLTALRAYFDRSLNSPSPAYRAYNDRLVAESCAVFAQVHNSTTPEQRSRAVRRLAAYERDVVELSGQR